MKGLGVLIWCQIDALIDGLLAQVIVVHPLLCPVLGNAALTLSLPTILNQYPLMLVPFLIAHLLTLLVPLFLVLFLLLVFIVVNLAILSANAMTIDPAVPILHKYTHLQLPLLTHCLFLTGHPFLAVSPLPQVTFNQKYPTVAKE